MALTTEKKVGLFFLAALVALGVMIELVQDWNPFQKQIPYHAFFESAVGIKVGDPVKMAGVEVGKIESITLEAGKVRVDFLVNEGTLVREDSLAIIRQTNLLGGQFLGLDFGSSTAPVLPPGSEVSSREKANIDQLLAHLDRNQERVFGNLGSLIEETREPLRRTVANLDRVVARIEAGEGTLGRLATDPRLYDDLEKTVTSLKAILGRIESGEGSLGRLLQDPTLYDNANATLANLDDLTSRVRRGEGTVGRLFTDDELYANASEALAELRTISRKANEGTGTLGRLVNDETLYEETARTMEHLRSIARKIDEGEGTLGKLVNEDDIYRNAKTTLHKVEKTVDGMSDTGPLSALGVVLGTFF